MGFIQYIKLESDLECPEAYTRIVSVGLNYELKECLIKIKTYKDYQARSKESKPIIPPEEYVVSNGVLKTFKQKTQDIFISEPKLLDNLSIFFDGNTSTPDIFIQEGVDFLLGETVQQSLDNIVNALNNNIAFNQNWECTWTTKYINNIEQYVLIISSKQFVLNSELNTIQEITNVMGSMFISRSPYLNEKQESVNEFDYYFADLINGSEIDIRDRGYEYLKTLDKFKNVTDY